MSVASVGDPLVELKELDSLLVTTGADSYSWQTYPAASASSTNVQWQFQLPSTNSIIDRCALVEANVQLV